MADFVLGLIEDPEVLREEAERQAEGERRRLRRADREAERLRGVLRGLDDKRERLMDLALDGPFDKDEIARRAASLEADREATEREMEGLGGDAPGRGCANSKSYPTSSWATSATYPTL